jgi:hypothetical protein
MQLETLIYNIHADCGLCHCALPVSCFHALAELTCNNAVMYYSVDFVGRGQLAERQQKLGQFLSKLQKSKQSLENHCVVIQNTLTFSNLPLHSLRGIQCGLRDHKSSRQ